MISRSSEFEDVLPVELYEKIEAYNRQERVKHERSAWYTAHIIAALVGKKVNHTKLIPEEFTEKSEKMTKKEREKEKREVKKQLGIK